MSEPVTPDDTAPELLPDPPQDPVRAVGTRPSAPRLLILNAIFPGSATSSRDA